MSKLPSARSGLQVTCLFPTNSPGSVSRTPASRDLSGAPSSSHSPAPRNEDWGNLRALSGHNEAPSSDETKSRCGGLRRQHLHPPSDRCDAPTQTLGTRPRYLPPRAAVLGVSQHLKSSLCIGLHILSYVEQLSTSIVR